MRVMQVLMVLLAIATVVALVVSARMWRLCWPAARVTTGSRPHWHR